MGNCHLPSPPSHTILDEKNGALDSLMISVLAQIPQRAEPETRASVHAVHLGRWSRETGVGDRKGGTPSPGVIQLVATVGNWILDEEEGSF